MRIKNITKIKKKRDEKIFLKMIVNFQVLFLWLSELLP